ncbi:histidine kinase/DNA gyrase B/HSP90-like ATPase [Neolewinella xylanilytica]|uniref:histidine kinase n=1 Tax=Neolewinella xylanilytica TaxID=1514080 RepID=A0A2S6IAN1_9BACT|nr:HAMP domain-containing sensor histidine kinase [Neolewinella xylanilytica]PPK88545.1 histidine kinase/DNA gyrase B/HSP90-like ATPase [Neolewinella xylanilytica]
MTLPTTFRWPIYLSVIGLAIVVASVWYTNRLANQLSVIEENYVRFFEASVRDINNFENAAADADFGVQGEIIGNNTTIPAIWALQGGGYVEAINWGGREADTSYILEQLDYLKENGKPPVEMPYGGLMYFGTSTLIQKLRLFPYIQLALIGTFLVVGVFGINQARRAEQNRVWVGMAKETAHQLGTPISAIMGWIEHLNTSYADNPELMEVSGELNKDVLRLEMVANRFSKIGATPELHPTNIYAELDHCRQYMQKRAPRKVVFDFPTAAEGNLPVAINPLLFDWVIENLLRNALDAMDGKGRISSKVTEKDDKVTIDITDTGKGITARNVRRVFDPGFTTKARGWGLGLSLVKRIIEEYHRGKIVVLHSEPGKGTTFRITLPRAKQLPHA